MQKIKLIWRSAGIRRPLNASTQLGINSTTAYTVCKLSHLRLYALIYSGICLRLYGTIINVDNITVSLILSRCFSRQLSG